MIFFTAFVGKEVELTSGCIIGTSCSLVEREVVPENTIMYGSECQRREMNDKPYVSNNSFRKFEKIIIWQ